MQKTRKSMVYTGLTILACIAMLVAATFAWFTDSVSNKGNKIVAGNLDVQLLKDGQDISNSTYPLFDYNLWEPGYSTGANLAVKNNGTLSVKYELELQNVAATQGIEQVIDVYVNEELKGTLANFMAGENLVEADVLKAGQTSEETALKFVMQTTAGNAYQGAQADFDILLKATQAADEIDGFGNPDYDAAAGYTTTVDSDDQNDVLNAMNALNNGDILKLNQNVTVTHDFDFTNPVTATMDLNSNTITGHNGNITTRVNKGGADITITNGKITAENGTYCTVGAGGNNLNSTATLRLNNMQLYNSTQNGNSVKAFVNGHIILNNVNSESVKGGGIEAAGGTVDVYNSTFTQKTNGQPIWNSVNIAASGGTGTVNVYSGSFTSENYGAYIFSSGGTINIYDGTFKADRAVLKADVNLGSYPDAVATINITGGSFDGKIEIAEKEQAYLNISGGTFVNTGLTLKQFKAYVADGHSVTESNGVFTVA